MIDEALKEYSISFHDDIASDAHALEMFKEHSFVQKMAEIMADYGEVEDCETCHYQQKGIKVDAYYFDDDHENLTLVVSHWIDDPDLQNPDVGRNSGHAAQYVFPCDKDEYNSYTLSWSAFLRHIQRELNSDSYLT